MPGVLGVSLDSHVAVSSMFDRGHALWEYLCTSGIIEAVITNHH